MALFNRAYAVLVSNTRTNRTRLDSAKSAPCVDCGHAFPSCAMDMDHVTAAKRGNISSLLHLPPSEFEAELSRCEPVCANCHRVRTQARRVEAHLAAADDADLLESLRP